MKPVRIVERTHLDGSVKYVIQTRFWFFRWRWADAGREYEYAQDTFPSLKEAQENICHFDGSRHTDRVVYTKGMHNA